METNTNKNIEAKTKWIVRRALIGYYTLFVFAVIIALVGYFSKNMLPLDIEDGMVSGIKTGSYLYMFVSIPFALWIYAKKSVKVEGDEKKLLKLALLRVCLVGFIFVFNLVLFYLCYDFNFLYAAGIGAIALLFCKVNSDEVKEKLEIENDSKNLN